MRRIDHVAAAPGTKHSQGKESLERRGRGWVPVVVRQGLLKRPPKGRGAGMGRRDRHLRGFPQVRLSEPPAGFSPYPTSRCGHYLSRRWDHRKPQHHLRHRSSRPVQPTQPSCLPPRLPPLRLVRSRLAETDGVTRRAGSFGIRSSRLADARLSA